MKNLILTCLLTIYCFLTFGQTLTKNINNRLLQKKELTEAVFSLPLGDFNFSPLFMHTDNSVIYGFIGDNYQRIRVKFVSVTKDGSSPDTYSIYGKSMVKNNICDFRGTIKISAIGKYKTLSYGVDSSYYNKGIKGQYVITGSYNFNENETQPHSGIFKGVFQSNFYLDKNDKVHYDDIDDVSDGFTNNQFIGQWISYKGNLVKQCNWGDFRIPNDGDLDIGAGEFSPGDKYLKYGWQSCRDFLLSNSKEKKAKLLKEAMWWK